MRLLTIEDFKVQLELYSSLVIKNINFKNNNDFIIKNIQVCIMPTEKGYTVVSRFKNLTTDLMFEIDCSSKNIIYSSSKFNISKKKSKKEKLNTEETNLYYAMSAFTMGNEILKKLKKF